MKAGTVFRRFNDREGREVTLRAPRWSDLDDMVEFINSLVEEETYIIMESKVTREEEMEWLTGRLSKLENDRMIIVAAEADGRFIGQTEVTPKAGRSKHVGELGIALKDGYRDSGIGTELMREAERQAPRLGIEILSLDVFANNPRGRHLYEKMGFAQVGREPRQVKMGGEYVDNIVMAKTLPG